MENILTMEKIKSKSVIIDGEVHGRFKEYCKNRSLKIGGIIENLIELYLEKPQEVEKLLSEIEKKY